MKDWQIFAASGRGARRLARGFASLDDAERTWSVYRDQLHPGEWIEYRETHGDTVTRSIRVLVRKPAA